MPRLTTRRPPDPAFASAPPISAFLQAPTSTFLRPTPARPPAPPHSKARPRRRATPPVSVQHTGDAPGAPASATGPPPCDEYTVRDWTFKSFRVQYAVSGDDAADASDAPALVLVHGFGANCQHWRRNLRPLAANGWRVYALDLLGFGMGDKPAPGTPDADGNPVAYNFDYWTAQLTAFIREVVHAPGAHRPVFFVANSIGAMVTMQAAVENPHLCAAQVFISPSLRQLNVRKRSWVQDITAPILMKMLNYRPLGRYFLDSLARPKQLKRVLLEAYENADAVDDDLIRILGQPAHTEGALDVFLSFIMYDDGPIPEDFLPVLSQPSLVIWGEEDRFEPFELGEALRHYSIVDEFVSFPDVGHCAHDELPDECNKLITDFVQKNLHRATVASR